MHQLQRRASPNHADDKTQHDEAGLKGARHDQVAIALEQGIGDIHPSLSLEHKSVDWVVVPSRLGSENVGNKDDINPSSK